MTDIPFGEYFTVETRWDVVGMPPAPMGAPCSRARPHPCQYPKGVLAPYPPLSMLLGSCVFLVQQYVASLREGYHPST